jgi:hypothetical protein
MVMKVFRITTEVQSTKTIQYCIEAESWLEANSKIIEGDERGEGEVVDENIDWKTEFIIETTFIEDLDN